ncbi:ATP synthase mitochondrial F1 complex assembly factor [Alteripontixanthobacter maritimus]|uniref:ATP synthase mitochondrial F1 complex assembly factor n=1 Tax=Alteripontixanthobacter maritimus TaxID=2161824 RepID=A0A369Q7W0_9SPHN|nr:ATP12 family protein [Alteripontixanthobacter maritimus]RDC59266.1 ATP synthase mitochondrial F1 complex assembly factor [Alteripontixanthobacter maritimus]
MKRFYKTVSVSDSKDGWQVLLDGRAIRRQGGAAQNVPSHALAEALAQEWRDQGETLDLARFPMRDMTDFALDVAAADRPALAAKTLAFAETDTLCYRADPGDALLAEQEKVWDPLLTAFEDAEGVRFARVSGIMHHAQPDETIATLHRRLLALGQFELTALHTAASLAASLCIGIAAMKPGSDIDALWSAAHLEEEWQARLWGRDEEAEQRNAERREAFRRAALFAKLIATQSS